MRAWLHPILDRLWLGLVPVDADFGRRKPLAEKDSTYAAKVQAEPRPPARETEWIPRSILYGPQL
ncbi:MAG: hypothetical protein ACREMK_02660 [Gemmatimonadota bacterium]